MPKGYPWKPRPIGERFWSKVNFNGPEIIQNSPCWVWTAALDGSKYGIFCINYFDYKAHRISFEWSFGPIIENKLLVLHHCDNPPCVNTEHLFLGTSKDNTHDMIRKGRSRISGDKNGNSKLTEDQVKSIRIEFGNLSYKQIMQKYDISPASVHNIVSRRSWKGI